MLTPSTTSPPSDLLLQGASWGGQGEDREMGQKWGFSGTELGLNRRKRVL